MVASSGAALNQLRVVIEIGLTGSGYLRTDTQANRNTVLVLDEASQIGPRPMLKLLELQARTGMTIKMLGDQE